MYVLGLTAELFLNRLRERKYKWCGHIPPTAHLRFHKSCKWGRSGYFDHGRYRWRWSASHQYFAHPDLRSNSIGLVEGYRCSSIGVTLVAICHCGDLNGRWPVKARCRNQLQIQAAKHNWIPFRVAILEAALIRKTPQRSRNRGERKRPIVWRFHRDHVTE